MHNVRIKPHSMAIGGKSTMCTRPFQRLLWMTWSINSIKNKLRVMPTIHFGAVKWKEKLPMVFTQGMGLKIDPFEFSTRSLGLLISNPEGSIFRSFSCIFGFCSCVLGPPLLYTFHTILIVFKPSFV
jgi:hypothetical protein